MQAQGVGDVAAAFADGIGQLLLGVGILVDELLVSTRLFEGVQIGALHVFNECDFQRFAVVEFTDQDGHIMDAGPLGSPPAPLACNNFITA